MNIKIREYHKSDARLVIEEKPPVYPTPAFGYVDNLCIMESYQRQGIASKLVQHTKEWFVQKGITRMECFVATKNPTSTSFWRKMGFQPMMEQMYINL